MISISISLDYSTCSTAPPLIFCSVYLNSINISYHKWLNAYYRGDKICINAHNVIYGFAHPPLRRDFHFNKIKYSPAVVAFDWKLSRHMFGTLHRVAASTHYTLFTSGGTTAIRVFGVREGEGALSKICTHF